MIVVEATLKKFLKPQACITESIKFLGDAVKKIKEVEK